MGSCKQDKVKKDIYWAKLVLVGDWRKLCEIGSWRALSGKQNLNLIPSETWLRQLLGVYPTGNGVLGAEAGSSVLERLRYTTLNGDQEWWMPWLEPLNFFTEKEPQTQKKTEKFS